MAADNEEGHPKFIEATDAIEHLQASGSPDLGVLFQWLLQAVEYAPESLKAEITRIIYRKGRFPVPTHSTPDGNPIFTAEQLAERFDVTVEDIVYNIEMLALAGILVIPPPSDGPTDDPPP